MITLPLAKLSHAPDADPEVQHFSWKHETHNLVLVLEHFRAGGSVSQLLKVVQGTKNLVQCEIEHLTNLGNELLRAAKERGDEMRNDQLPISAIVRCPLLAIRWQLPNRKIRRVQLKFLSDQHFDAVYRQLLQLGLRMTSSVAPGKPAVSVVTHGGPSCPPSRLAEISNRPLTAVSATTTPSPQFQSQEAGHGRPPSTISGTINADRNAQSHNYNPLVPPEYFPRPSSATSSTLSFPSSKVLSSAHDNPLPTIEEVPSRPPSSPGTAFMYSESSRPNTSDSMLPPRRALPFLRSSPKSSGSDSGRPSSRPSTGLMGPPPLPNRSSPQRPGSSHTAASNERVLLPLPRPTIVGEVPEQNQAMMPSSGSSRRADDSLWLTEQPATELMAPQPHPGSLPASYQSASSHVHSPSRPLRSLSQPAQNEFRSEALKAMPLHMGPGSSRQEATVAESLGRPSMNNVGDGLAVYAAQSEDGRMAALNEFIFRHLESNEFLTLVEDMESCWARVGLGL